MTHEKDLIEARDIVIIDRGILGKYAYEVVTDIISVKLRDISTHKIEKVFRSYKELEEFIASDPEHISWVSMH